MKTWVLVSSLIALFIIGAILGATWMWYYDRYVLTNFKGKVVTVPSPSARGYVVVSHGIVRWNDGRITKRDYRIHKRK